MLGTLLLTLKLFLLDTMLRPLKVHMFTGKLNLVREITNDMQNMVWGEPEPVQNGIRM